jgi:hypothetical protein
MPAGDPDLRRRLTNTFVERPKVAMADFYRLMLDLSASGSPRDQRHRVRKKFVREPFFKLTQAPKRQAVMS